MHHSEGVIREQVGVRVARATAGLPNLRQMLPGGALVNRDIHGVVGSIVAIGRTPGVSPVECARGRIRHKGVGAFGGEALDLRLAIGKIPLGLRSQLG